MEEITKEQLEKEKELPRYRRYFTFKQAHYVSERRKERNREIAREIQKLASELLRRNKKAGKEPAKKVANKNKDQIK